MSYWKNTRATMHPAVLRNKLEDKVRDRIIASGLPAEYEAESLLYTRPSSEHSYTPDFKIGPNVFVEAKGLWDYEDRTKILHVLDQHPEVIVCMAFQNADKPIRKGSSTTYADWCDQYLIPWIDTRYDGIPEEWINVARSA